MKSTMKSFMVFFTFLLLASAQRHPFVHEIISNNPVPVAGEYRLPTNVIPNHYNIILEPFFETASFRGSVSIEASIAEATSTIVLHKRDIEVNSTTVSDLDTGVDIPVVSTAFDDTLEFFTITLENELAADVNVKISISYNGILNDRNEGFYLAKYDDENGNERLLGTTQFEATEARLAFPCFDEPALKATFNIQMIRPTDYNTVSNMELISSEALDDTRVLDTFATSVKMSSYLVAFVVSDFAMIEADTHSVYARAERINAGDGALALASSPQMITAMETAVNVSYSLPKISQIGLPDGYFSAGAMENWGCVTYREKYLMFTEGVSTENDKENVVSIIAHEYAHQWFGDLVSPLWWEYLWLNEGFATFFEWYAPNDYYPEWQLLQKQLVNSVQYALGRDSGITRPMSQPVETPNQINALFDAIAYDKSGSVLRMFQHILSNNTFMNGLNIYLNARQYDSGHPDQLFEGLQAAVDAAEANALEGQTVKEIFDTWHLQAGYPLITVTRDYENGGATIGQNRYITLNPNEHPEIYRVPINYATPDSGFDNTLPTSWLTERSAALDLTAGADQWVILNNQATGYFRITYDDTNWALINAQLDADPEAIHPNNRAQIVDDLADLGISEIVKYEQVLNMLKYIKKETEYGPMKAFFNAVNHIDKLLSGSSVQIKFRKYVIELVNHLYENANKMNKFTSEEVINNACQFGLEKCIKDMMNYFEGIVQPEMQKNVYCHAIRYGTPDKFLKLFQMYRESKHDHERARILHGLTCTEDVDLINKLISGAVSKNRLFGLREGDAYNAILGIASRSKEGAMIVLKKIIEHYNGFKYMFNAKDFTKILIEIAERVNTEEGKMEMLSLLKRRSNVEVYKHLSNIIEENLIWKSKFIPVFEQYFK